MLIWLSSRGLRLITYTLLFDFIIARVIDLIGERGYAGKGFMIVCILINWPKINDELGRGVTHIWSKLPQQKDLNHPVS